MSLEEAAVLGERLSLISSKSDIPLALFVWESCLRNSVAEVVLGGNTLRLFYYRHDGWRERDAQRMMVPAPEGECPALWDLELKYYLLGMSF